jgi:imidazoleglycerol phosphate dehydratase HisB
MRISKIERNTLETQVRVELNIDGRGESVIHTGIGFLDHMLTLVAKHGLFDLHVEAKGDLETDDHHTVEDIGIALGQAFKEALGNKKGIQRYGYMLLPMDEVLVLAAIDLSGRPYTVFDASFSREKIGDLSTEMVSHFFYSFATNVLCNLHIKLFQGASTHHKIEGIFKAFARALRMACEIDLRATEVLPTTKGVL